MQHCEGLGCFCGQILIKGLDVVFLKAASPQTVQGNVLDSRFEVCSEVLCCYSVSQSDCHTEQHTILMLAVAWRCTLVLLLLLQSEKGKVMCLCFSSTTLKIHY